MCIATQEEKHWQLNQVTSVCWKMLIVILLISVGFIRHEGETIGGGDTVAGPARYATLASSAVIFLGLLKLNTIGPGLTETVKDLWRKNK